MRRQADETERKDERGLNSGSVACNSSAPWCLNPGIIENGSILFTERVRGRGKELGSSSAVPFELLVAVGIVCFIA